MTEDDTFNRLKRWTFEDTDNFIPSFPAGSSGYSVGELFVSTGWTPTEYLEECWNRNKHRITMSSLKTKDQYLTYWLHFWDIK